MWTGASLLLTRSWVETIYCLLSGDTLALLSDQRLVDVGDDSSSGDGGLDQSVQLFVSCKEITMKYVTSTDECYTAYL